MLSRFFYSYVVKTRHCSVIFVNADQHHRKLFTDQSLWSQQLLNKHPEKDRLTAGN